MKDRSDLLIEILYDPTAREDERDDAAADLYKFEGEKVINALFDVAKNPNETFVRLPLLFFA